MNDEAKAMLDKMLSAINLSINTNTHIIEFRSESGNSANIAKAIAEKIKSLNPKHILCAGEAASTLFSPPHSPLATPHSLYTMYHPKELLADASLKRPAWEDVKKIRSALGV
jgi:DNA polymerase